MSTSCLIAGVFRLINHTRQQVISKTTNNRTYFDYYDSGIMSAGMQQGPERLAYRAVISIYSPMNSQVHPDNTLVYLIGRLAARDGETLINAYFMLPFGQDADNEEDAECAEDVDQVQNLRSTPFVPPWFFIIGHVTKTPGKSVNGEFTLRASEFVVNETISFDVHCKFDTTQPRWKKPPTPWPSTSVQVAGPFTHIHNGWIIGIGIEHMTLSLAPLNTATQHSNPTAESDDPSTPKRRKYVAEVPRMLPPSKTPTKTPTFANSSPSYSASFQEPSTSSSKQSTATDQQTVAPSSTPKKTTNLSSDYAPPALSTRRRQAAATNLVESTVLPRLTSTTPTSSSSYKSHKPSKSIVINESPSANLSSKAKGKRRATNEVHPDFEDD